MSAPAEKRTGLTEVSPLPSVEKPLAGSTKAHARALRRERGRRLAIRLALFVALPSSLAAVYFGLVASEQFESYAIFNVQSSESRPAFGMDGLLAGLASGSGSAHDALAVRDYALSRDMLQRLNKELGFVAHYKNGNVDPLSRLKADATLEDAYEYFGQKVYVDYDQVSGALTVRVRAFDAEQAAKTTAAILAYSEEMVNKLSERERRDRTAYAEGDVAKAEQRLSRARSELVALQQKYEDFNPLQTASAAMTVRTALEGELAKARAELMQLKSFMNPVAPQVLAATEKVKSLSAQVSGESKRLVDPKKSNGLNASLSDFEAAMVEKEFAQKAYESAMASLEIARADADRQHRYVAVVASPSKPDESTYPHRFRSVLAAFVISFLLFGIGTLSVAAVREHARL